jgi:hypothetical protein
MPARMTQVMDRMESFLASQTQPPQYNDDDSQIHKDGFFNHGIAMDPETDEQEEHRVDNNNLSEQVTEYPHSSILPSTDRLAITPTNVISCVRKLTL